MGLLAGENDYELMERTHYDRNISRHNYTVEEIDRLVKKPVVQRLCHLMQFRNEYPVFDGEMKVYDTEDSILKVEWKDGALCACLDADLKKRTFEITYTETDGSICRFDPERDFTWSGQER